MSVTSTIVILTVLSALTCNAASAANAEGNPLQELLNKYRIALGLSSSSSSAGRTENRAGKPPLASDWSKGDSTIKRDGKQLSPDGFPAVRFMGPGKPPTNAIEKRGGQEECGDDEWFVFVDQRSACVQPQWESAYDPTFCTRMRNKWVYCGCDDVTNIPGMKDGIDTCIDKAQVEKNGRCSIKPCKEPYKCVDSKPGIRYDCVDGDTTIPNWYGEDID